MQPSPATRPSPPPLPDGWTVAPPDYVGVGTARSGTTWWDHLISTHPNVARAPGRPKEIHFFDQLYDEPPGEHDAAAYHAFFGRPADGASDHSAHPRAAAPGLLEP